MTSIPTDFMLLDKLLSGKALHWRRPANTQPCFPLGQSRRSACQHNNKQEEVTPGSTGVERGLFSTRSPNRPNPIGLTVVRLERVEGRRLYVSGVDAFDKTPVLAIKPYVSRIDSCADAEMKAEKELGLDR